MVYLRHTYRGQGIYLSYAIPAVFTLYCTGVFGLCSFEHTMFLPVSFAKVDADDWSQESSGPGRSLSIAFHRTVHAAHVVSSRPSLPIVCCLLMLCVIYLIPCPKLAQ